MAGSDYEIDAEKAAVARDSKNRERWEHTRPYDPQSLRGLTRHYQDLVRGTSADIIRRDWSSKGDNHDGK